MIKGLFFFETGELQQIGELSSLSSIIASIKQVLPELEASEAQRLLAHISDEDLKKLLAERERESKK